MAVEVTDEQLEQYIDIINSLSHKAGTTMYRYFTELGWYGQRDAAAMAMVDAMMLIVEQYGDAIAAAQAAWIEQMYLAGGNTTAAQIVQGAAFEALAEARKPQRSMYVGYVDTLARRDWSTPAMREATGREAAAQIAADAKRRGADIIEDVVTRTNADERILDKSVEGLMVCWVPHSAFPCGFCTMLASNPWRVARQSVLRQYKEHIHSNCSCVQVFKPADATVDGVDHKEYLKRVEAVRFPVRTADGTIVPQYLPDTGKANPAYWREVRNAINRNNYKETEVRDHIRELHREQYRRTHEDSD